MSEFTDHLMMNSFDHKWSRFDGGIKCAGRIVDPWKKYRCIKKEISRLDKSDQPAIFPLKHNYATSTHSSLSGACALALACYSEKLFRLFALVHVLACGMKQHALALTKLAKNALAKILVGTLLIFPRYR